MICDSPIYVDSGTGGVVPVPCGKCPPCKHRRVNDWVFRLLNEDKVSTTSHFVTLTYDTDHVPISRNGYMTLRKKDFQDYMKRLRKLCVGFTLKYYAVGEYGTTNKRPHYHAIIFNCPNPDFFYDAWHLNGIPIGSIHVGQVSGDSIAYTMKYIDKASFERKHARDDREPEFPLMSKGLGASYLTDQVISWHRSDLKNTYVHKDGFRIALPRYYVSKIFTDQQRRYQALLAQDAANKIENEQRADYQRFKYEKDFETYKDERRYGRHKTFYNTQKKRDV